MSSQETIETKDLVLYKPQRLTDNDDGGGKYSGEVIVDGQSNELFDDPSLRNRTTGNVSIRKSFAGVISNNAEKLLGPIIFISKVPDDPAVSVLLFNTNSHDDELLSAQNRIESYLAKGAKVAGQLLDAAYEGMKSIQVCMDLSENHNAINDTIALILDEGLPIEFAQYVRITDVAVRTATIRINTQNYEYKVVTYAFNDALLRDFGGVAADEWHANKRAATTIRDTIVADAGKYYGSVKLTADAEVDSFTVNVPSIFSQLVPAAQSETPLLDVSAAGESLALIATSNSAMAVVIATQVSTEQSLYLGTGVLPGSIGFSLFGQAVTDNAGQLKNSVGQVGTIDYQTGHIQWTSAAGSGNATLTITFKPAAAPTQINQTHAVHVTQQNQSSNYTGILVPPPAPGSLAISYMSQGNYYQIKDDGSGKLSGIDAAYGVGSINFETGTWALTAGALPDVGTPILLTWATPITAFVRSDVPVAPVQIPFDLNQTDVLVGVTASWLVNGVNKTATSTAQGTWSGDATGFINHASGTGYLVPDVLPNKGVVIDFAYNFGERKTQSETVSPSNGTFNFVIGNGQPVQPNSIQLDAPIDASHTVTLIDVPLNATTGKLIDASGTNMGSITYATGAVSITPSYTRVSYELTYTDIEYASDVISL